MYIKVIIFTLISFFISGCSIFNSPKPISKPKMEQNITMETNTTTLESNTTIITPIQEDKIIVKGNKYGLKPEPFSLDSNEDDPELLGPQTTLDRTLDETSTNKIDPIVTPDTPKIIKKDNIKA